MVPVAYLGRPQLLQRDCPEIRNDPELGELAVSFAGLRREIGITIEPTAKVVGDYDAIRRHMLTVIGGLN
jgi:hypothetical protein